MITRIDDSHAVSLGKDMIDSLFYELNKALRKKMKKLPKNHKADLYVVGGACVVTTLHSRHSTTDVDAVWTIGAEMRECINEVADKFNLSHNWCNCDFKRTKSYTSAIMYNSHVYREYDRLIVRMVNLDLLLVMKLIAFREYKQTDMEDCISIINTLKVKGFIVNTDFICSIVSRYFDINDLSDAAKKFIGLR